MALADPHHVSCRTQVRSIEPLIGELDLDAAGCGRRQANAFGRRLGVDVDTVRAVLGGDPAHRPLDQRRFRGGTVINTLEVLDLVEVVGRALEVGFSETRLDQLSADDIELVGLTILQGHGAFAPVNADQETHARGMGLEGAGLDQVVGISRLRSGRLAGHEGHGGQGRSENSCLRIHRSSSLIFLSQHLTIRVGTGAKLRPLTVLCVLAIDDRTQFPGALDAPERAPVKVVAGPALSSVVTR